MAPTARSYVSFQKCVRKCFALFYVGSELAQDVSDFGDALTKIEKSLCRHKEPH